MTFWSAKRVVVTGGAGFTGSHVVAALRRQSCREIFVVRSRQYDLTREDQVRRLFEDTHPDVVIHLAGVVGNIASTNERPADSFYQNLLMGTFVLNYSHLFGVRKFVATIAGCDYPDAAPLPFKESSLWDGLPQRETAAYSLPKRMLHIQAQAYSQQYGFPSVILIPGNIYGPGDNFDLRHARVIAALVRRFVEATDACAEEVAIWGTGLATRDFIYATDVARGVLLAAERGKGGEIFNISSGRETSIGELVDLTRGITGFTGRVTWDTSRPDGQMRRWLDTSKARELLGFVSETDLGEGLRETVAWYQAYRSALAAAAGSWQG